MSNQVKWARRELELAGVEKDISYKLVKMLQIFANMGHSGMSAMYTAAIFNKLLRFEPLTELTDDPAEWMFVAEDVWGKPGGIWQSTRNPEAFSNDEGKHYYLLSEGGNDQKREPLHESASAACRRFHPGEECKPGENHPAAVEEVGTDGN